MPALVPVADPPLPDGPESPNPTRPTPPAEYAVTFGVATDGAPAVIVRVGQGPDASVAELRGPIAESGLESLDFVVLLADLVRPGWLELSAPVGPDMPVLAPLWSEGPRAPRVIRRRVFVRGPSAEVAGLSGRWHVTLGTATTFDAIPDPYADVSRWDAFHRAVFPRVVD